MRSFAALTGFSYKKMYGCVTRTKKSGRKSKITVLTTSLIQEEITQISKII